jgi:protein ImuB
VGASERLFGKAGGMAKRLEQELAHLGYRAATGSAPTPEAAWLAAHDGCHVGRNDNLRRLLTPLPIDCLQLEAETRQAMEKMGLRQLKDLLRLPRKSLARRFGPALADYLDRLLGIRSDVWRTYRPPEKFSSRLDLSAEITHTQALLFPLRRMMEELCGILRGSDAAVQQVCITLGHERAPDSVLKLGLQSPCQDSARLLAVLRERLERLQLPGAVRDIRLNAPRMLKFAPGQIRLFRDASGERDEGVAELAERLQARLGHEAVGGITGVEDHRPEYSWRVRALGETDRCTPLPHRPAWLLPRPRRCDIRRYEILSGPERIESGWWDGRDCRRDYFVVRDEHGCRLWAFHEYKPRSGWYLHGIFS